MISNVSYEILSFLGIRSYPVKCVVSIAEMKHKEMEVPYPICSVYFHTSHFLSLILLAQLFLKFEAHSFELMMQFSP